MACKKSELISAINSFATARATNDSTLVNFSAALVSQLIDTLEYAPEDIIDEEITEDVEELEPVAS
tara:strand:+ start:1040 stop:1237 length:198 start_codon:yes stop_codon:yes gene_type:complete